MHINVTGAHTINSINVQVKFLNVRIFERSFINIILHILAFDMFSWNTNIGTMYVFHVSSDLEYKECKNHPYDTKMNSCNIKERALFMCVTDTTTK